MQTLRQFAARVLTLLFVAVAGCGDDAPQPQTGAGTSTTPGTLELVVKNDNSLPGYKLEARLLRPPSAGESSTKNEEGTTMIFVPAPGMGEGPDMPIVQRGETDSQGKVRLPNIPPGRYLLSVGSLGTGIYREWIVVEPGATRQMQIKLPGRTAVVKPKVTTPGQ